MLVNTHLPEPFSSAASEAPRSKPAPRAGSFARWLNAALRRRQCFHFRLSVRPRGQHPQSP